MIERTRTGMIVALACVLASGLAACSGADAGVELNGKVFDAVGLGSGGKKGSEPKLAERAPLVPPPRTNVLPTPGVTESGDHMAWPDDPDKRRAASAGKAAAVNCNTIGETMVGRPEIERIKREADCRAEQGGLLTGMASWLPSGGNKKEGAAAVATDEGDPGIVTGSIKPATGGKAPSR